MKVLSQHPEWGRNYDRGYIGFTFSGRSFVSMGIAFFERWDRYSDIPVSHVLVVTGWDQCVEALPRGVTSSPLEPYFNDPHTLIFFRKPRFYGWNLGTSIAEAAAKHVGHKYGFGLLVAHALKNTAAGRLLNHLTFDAPNRLVSRLLDHPRHQICSELAAMALNAQPELRDLGCLAKPARLINPQELFEDDAIFEPWRASRIASSTDADPPPSSTE